MPIPLGPNVPYVVPGHYIDIRFGDPPERPFITIRAEDLDRLQALVLRELARPDPIPRADEMDELIAAL